LKNGEGKWNPQIVWGSAAMKNHEKEIEESGPIVAGWEHSENEN
jgi:hypothetical protein